MANKLKKYGEDFIMKNKKMKILVLLLVALFCSSTHSTNANALGTTFKMVSDMGYEYTITPDYVIRDGRTLIQVRDITEKFG